MDSGAISSQQGQVGTRQRKARLEEEWKLPRRGKGGRRKILRSLPLPWSFPLVPPPLCLKAKRTLMTAPLGLDIHSSVVKRTCCSQRDHRAGC